MVRWPILNEMCELIVYACPTGPLLTQIEAYMHRTRHALGSNAAHAYMPHCTLTGFYRDTEASIAHYAQTLSASIEWLHGIAPITKISITGMLLQPEFHCLKVESEHLLLMMQYFAAKTNSDTLLDKLRLKDWLHISLAYQFPVQQHIALASIAQEMIDIYTPVDWRLRLYQRHEGNKWKLHREWAL